MSQSISFLNPPKTFNKKNPFFQSFPSFPSSSSSSLCTIKTKRLPITSLAMRPIPWEPSDAIDFISLPLKPVAIRSMPEKPSLDILNGRGRYHDELLNVIRRNLPNCLFETHLHETIPGLKFKTKGKVRDVYDAGDYVVLVTTDRQSAFDRVLASIPFKGEVLNETSLWWFDKTQHITPNAVVSAPDKNVTIAKKCSVFPVEFVVRGYVTGSTDTSLWTVYNRGIRNYCGNVLVEGMVKNQRLPENILTPTTKCLHHDLPVSPSEIIDFELMTQAEYDEASTKALKLFEYGQRVALEHGLILVDTKYEFGKGPDGTIILIDEVHTPDSSRYWIAQSYEKRFQNGLEPLNVDKEFLRLWFKQHCNPYEDDVLPDAPEELVCELAWRYILLYETITNSRFEPPREEELIHDRISRNVSLALSSLKQ